MAEQKWRCPRCGQAHEMIETVCLHDQPEQLDLLEGRRRRDVGVQRVQFKNAGWVQRARKIAREIALAYGTVTADDVRVRLYARGDEPAHPNAWGAVFRCADFQPTGQFRQSRVPSRHASVQRVWKLSR